MPASAPARRPTRAPREPGARPSSPAALTDTVRAPAFRVVGTSAGAGGTAHAFRLPCPPSWEDPHGRPWAGERRAAHAYRAALDALATGVVLERQAARLRALVATVESETGGPALHHLERVLAFVRRSPGRPVVAPPPAPLTHVVITVPPPRGAATPAALTRRYAITLRWLRDHRYLASRDLRVEWCIARPAPAPRPTRDPLRDWSDDWSDEWDDS